MRSRRSSYGEGEKETEEEEEEDDEEQQSLAIGMDVKRSARKGRRGSIGKSLPPTSLMPSPSRLVLGDEGMRNEIRCCGAVMKGELEAIKKWESIRGHQGDRILQLGNEPLQVFDTFGKRDTDIDFIHAYRFRHSYICIYISRRESFTRYQTSICDMIMTGSCHIYVCMYV